MAVSRYQAVSRPRQPLRRTRSEHGSERSPNGSSVTQECGDRCWTGLDTPSVDPLHRFLGVVLAHPERAEVAELPRDNARIRTHAALDEAGAGGAERTVAVVQEHRWSHPSSVPHHDGKLRCADQESAEAGRRPVV
jgi:hypothetical protein